MIQIVNWKHYQHYKERRPPWIKLYRDLLSDYDFLSLGEEDRWLLVGLWIMAADTENEIPEDPLWITNRVHSTRPVTTERLNLLQTLGFIEIRDSASNPLAKCYAETEVEVETETEKTSAGADVENSEFEDAIMPIIRQKWWQAPEPPIETTMAEECGMAKTFLRHKWLDFDSLVGGLGIYDGPPATMRLLRTQPQKLQELVGQWRKSEEARATKLGNILKEITPA